MEKYICNEGKTGKIVKEKIMPIKNSYYVKPNGGLWCCRENTPEGYSWEDWCENNEPEWLSDKRSIITLKEDAKILVINSAEVYDSLPKAQPREHEIPSIFGLHLDFEKLAQEYDVIDFRISEFYDLYDIMYGLDCDSCLIMNQECIQNIEEQTKSKSFESIKTFFEDNTKVKQIMLDMAPDIKYSIDEYAASKLDDKMWQGLNNLQDLFLEMVGNDTYRQDFINSKFSSLKSELIEAGCNFDKLQKFYQKNISDMSPKFIESVNKEIFGFCAFRNTGLFQQATTVNEMLHVLHREIETNDGLIQQIAGNLNYPVVGTETELSQKIKDVVSLMKVNDYGYIVSLDENHAFALMRDKGHALTIEFNANGNEIEVNYYIPKICNAYMVNNLPGIRKVAEDAKALTATTGAFNMNKKEFGVKLLTFLENVPSDDNIPWREGDTLKSAATHVEIEDILSTLSVEELITFGKINPEFVLTETYKDALSSAIQKENLSIEEQTNLIGKLNELDIKETIQTDIIK